jgi:hypothetical protein
MKPWQWGLLLIGTLLGYLVVGALITFDPHSVVEIQTTAGKIVRVPTANADGSGKAAFILAIPILYVGLVQALRVELPDGFAEGAGLFVGGLAIGSISEPIRNSWLAGAIVGIAIAAVSITLVQLGRDNAWPA